MRFRHLNAYFWQAIGILAIVLGLVGYTGANVAPGVLLVAGMAWLQIGLLHARVDSLLSQEPTE